MLLFTLLLLAFFHVNAAQDPMSCVEVTVNITGSGQFGNYSVTGNVKLYPGNGTSNTVEVSNVVSMSYDTGLPVQGICQIPSNDCMGNVSAAYNFTSEYEFFETSMAVDGLNKPFWRGYIDEGSFAANNGFVYSPNSTCMQWMNPSLGTHKECCKTFAPAVKPAHVYPKCKVFTSQTQILNAADNSTFAGITMNYTLNGNIVTAMGNFSVPNDVQLFYRCTDFMMSVHGDTKQIFGNATLPMGDAKFFAFALFSPSDSGYVTTGRFILRNDRTLREEGFPFTYQQNCNYFNEQFKLNSTKISYSQFCCQTFDA